MHLGIREPQAVTGRGERKRGTAGLAAEGVEPRADAVLCKDRHSSTLLCAGSHLTVKDIDVDFLDPFPRILEDMCHGSGHRRRRPWASQDSLA